MGGAGICLGVEDLSCQPKAWVLLQQQRWKLPFQRDNYSSRSTCVRSGWLVSNVFIPVSIHTCSPAPPESLFRERENKSKKMTLISPLCSLIFWRHWEGWEKRDLLISINSSVLTKPQILLLNQYRTPQLKELHQTGVFHLLNDSHGGYLDGERRGH